MWNMYVEYFAWQTKRLNISEEQSLKRWSSQPQTQGEKPNLPKVLAFEYATEKNYEK